VFEQVIYICVSFDAVVRSASCAEHWNAEHMGSAKYRKPHVMKVNKLFKLNWVGVWQPRALCG